MRMLMLAAAAALSTLVVTPTLAQDAPTSSIDDVLALVETDPADALRRGAELAAAGDAEAMNLLAVMLELGGPTWEADPAASRMWMERAVAAGSSVAHLNLSLRLILADDSTGWTRGVELLRVAEQDEQLQAMTHYPWAYAYLFGRGVDQDLIMGSERMRLAVEADPDNMQAQFLLARSYETGWAGVEQPELAYGHMRIAAEAGDYRAQWRVGMMLLEGRGTLANPAEAYGFVRASGEAGYAEGMISTAVMLALGQGVVADPEQARDWYENAAIQHSSAHALRGLGFMVLQGEGGSQDADLGVAYLELAAGAGEVNARNILASVMPELEDRLDRAWIDAFKADWVRDHGPPR